MKIKESIALKEREMGGNRKEGRSEGGMKEGRDCSEGIRKEELTAVCSCILSWWG